MKDEQVWKESTIMHLLAMAYMDGYYARMMGEDVLCHRKVAEEKAKKAVETKSSEVYE